MATTTSRQFSADSTTDDVLEGIDLSGRVALVTGGAGGLGAETARSLLSKGASVTITVRDAGRAAPVVEQIREGSGSDAIEVLELDLAVPDSVRGAAKRWLAEHDRLDVLINNAGVMACPLQRTAEGWEMQLASNHIGHFLLTGLLAPALLAAAPARVVNLTSGGHKFSDVDFDDLHFERRDYDKWVAYGQSKTANVLFTCELDRRLRGRGVRSLAVHPGVIMTGLARHLTQEDLADLMKRGPRGSGPMQLKQPTAGAATSVWAATAPELLGRGALYLEDCRIGEQVDDASARDGYFAYAMDEEHAGRLWSVTEDHLGERFDL